MIGFQQESWTLPRSPRRAIPGGLADLLVDSLDRAESLLRLLDAPGSRDELDGGFDRRESVA
jgi:hypothetical protein